MGQLRRGLRSGRLDEQFQCVGAEQSEVGVGIQGRGEVLTQGVAQPLEDAGVFPDQRLMSAGNDLDGLGLFAVSGDRP